MQAGEQASEPALKSVRDATQRPSNQRSRPGPSNRTHRKRSDVAKRTPPPKDPLPNMRAVADETRNYLDPLANYELARIARAARAEGAARAQHR